MKFRLLNVHREKLRLFARRSLVCAAEAQAEAEAYGRLMVVVDLMCRTLAPPEDMVVLRRHHATAHVSGFNVRAPSRTGRSDVRYLYLCLCPRDPADGPIGRGCQKPRHERVMRELPEWVVGNGRHSSLHVDQLPAPMAADLIERYDAWFEAATAHDDARHEILCAVRSLIDSSRTLEALVEKWPAAEHAREALGAKLLPVAVNPSELERTIAAATFFVPASLDEREP